MAFVLRLLWPLVAKNFIEWGTMVNNCACYICKYYNSDISVKNIIDWGSLYRIEYRILNTHPKCLPVKSSATKFLRLIMGYSTSEPSR